MFDLRQAFDWLGSGRLIAADAGQLAVPIRSVSTDTRRVAAGELFVALRGERFDAHDFVSQALDAGASALLIDHWTEGCRAPALWVSDTRRAMGEIAAGWRRTFTLPLIAVTGSNGKTTVKEMIASILNNDIGVPLTLFRADAGTEALVVEMGTNGKGEIAALAAIARPTVGVVTTVGFSHLAGLGSIEGVAHEKADLVRALPREGVAVLNADNRWTADMARETDARVVTYSLEGAGDLNARDIRFENGQTHLTLEGYEISSPLLGLHNVHNLLAALAACQAIGLPWPEVLPAVSRLKPAQRRMEQHELGGFTLIDDSYNANPDSVRAAIDLLASLPGPRWLILGDMGEVGVRGPQFHAEVGAYARERGIDTVWTAGALGVHAAADRHFADTAALRDALAGGPAAVSLLVKGSRFMKMESVVAALQQASAQGGPIAA